MENRVALSDYWADIYSRKGLIFLTAASAAGLAYFASINLPPIYEAKTIFYTPINIALPSYNNLGVAVGLGQAPFVPPTEEKLASTGVGILRSKNVFRRLASEFPSISEDSLRKNTDIKVSREFMLEVYVRDVDPQLAAAIANRFPSIYQEFQSASIRDHMEAIRQSALRELSDVELTQAEVRGRSRQPAGDSPDMHLLGSTDERLRAVADRLRSVAGEAALQARQPTAPVVVVETAEAPRRPVFPLPVLNAMVACVTGFALGLYYALVCGMVARARRIRIERQLEMPHFSTKDLEVLRNSARLSS
jgi:uncharacterized protein involved in exopolysaccharide biosynthesis